MKKTVLAIALVFSAPMSFAEHFADKADAQALVVKVVKAVAADREGTFKEITGKNSKWVQGDLYPFVYNLNGVILAHGQNERMVGKDLIDMQDADGKPMVKERMELAKTNKTFWQDYKWKDPVTQKVQQKSSYCEKTGETLVCAGIYKR